MFSYLGSKSRVAHLYPAPTRGRVIEPFAGSARYSLLHRKHDVWLNDIDPLIVAIWKYIQRATVKEIKALPELRAGDRLDRYRSLSVEERALLGYCLGYGQAGPGITCTRWADENRTCSLLKRRLLEHREYVRDWTITNLHYADLPDEEVCWFVDPPYQHSRGRYRYHCISDYDRLGAWCRSRRGQVIVCEGRGADWLPFRPFAEQQVGTGEMYKEVVWTGPQ
jgi:site-specific DNA-adenine methylase